MCAQRVRSQVFLRPPVRSLEWCQPTFAIEISEDMATLIDVDVLSRMLFEKAPAPRPYPEQVRQVSRYISDLSDDGRVSRLERARI